jgi:two-component sensor histidine kinase
METERLRALVSEQAHRGKNMMAIIQSIALRTISDGRDVAEVRAALVGRIRTLARTSDLLAAASNAQGAALADIVEAELSDVGHRVTTAGPRVRVSGPLVQTLALAVHELATNAIKYGALCAPGGTVAVDWTFFERGSERYLEIGWTERGGPPPVKAAPRHGFGLSLISSMAGSGAEVPNFSFERDGFACRMRLSQDMIAAE